jgi:hypothetical protein
MYINSESQMSHINNSPALQIITFQVRLNTGRIINEPIENIQELSNIIRQYGLGIIAKISFYFRDNRHQFHNLILRNTEYNDRFVVEFYHYYNQYMERVKLSREERLNDFTEVMNCIRGLENLDSQLGKHIIDPFYYPQIVS